MTDTLRARCSDDVCGHVWIIAYQPMEMTKAAALMKRAACPKCARIRPLMAGPTDEEPSNV
jgi:hypothetical protein